MQEQSSSPAKDSPPQLPATLMLSIGVGRGVSEQDFIKVHDELTRRVKLLLPEVDRCQSCGFQGKLIAHHPNDIHDVHDERLGDCYLICDFCHAAAHLEMAGDKGGMVVRLPEISQGFLSRIMRALQIGVSIGAPNTQDMAKRIVTALQGRAQMCAQEWGSSKPKDFHKAIQSIGELTYEESKGSLVDLRFVPSGNSPLIDKKSLEVAIQSARKADPQFERAEELMALLKTKEVLIG